MRFFEKRRGGLLVAGLVLAIGMLATPGLAGAEPVGFVAAFEGSVEVQSAGSTSWAAALLDRDLEIGDVVRTGPSSAIKILLADETILALGESTELTIDSYVVGSAATRDPSVLKLLKGKARVLVGEAFGGPTRVEMHTPTAVIGVKGTKFEAYIVEDATRGVWTLVCNLGGSIFVRQIDEKTARTVRPQLELCTRVLRDRPPSDEIRRPAGFAPVPVLSSRPSPGVAEVLGRPGVSAASQSPSGGKLLDFVTTEDPGLNLADSPLDEGGAELGNVFIEDAQQASEAAGESFREPSLPGAGAPQQPLR